MTNHIRTHTPLTCLKEKSPIGKLRTTRQLSRFPTHKLADSDKAHTTRTVDFVTIKPAKELLLPSSPPSSSLNLHSIPVSTAKTARNRRGKRTAAHNPLNFFALSRMSERRAHRRQAAVSRGGRSSRPPQPSPPAARRSSFRHLKPAQRLERCSSEPSLWNSAEDLVGDGPGDLRQSVSSNDGVLFSPLSCTDVLASSPSLMGSSSPGGLEVKVA